MLTARKPKCLSTDEWLNRHGLPVPSKILADKKKWSINTCKTWVIPEDGMLSEKKPFTKGLLLLLLLSRFSHVRLYATLETAAHQASPSLGFSRQEQWSGLPFPSPMHESEKWKGSCPVVSDSQRPHGLQPTRLLRPWVFHARVLEWGAIAFSVQKVYVIPFTWKSPVSKSVDTETSLAANDWSGRRDGNDS